MRTDNRTLAAAAAAEIGNTALQTYRAGRAQCTERRLARAWWLCRSVLIAGVQVFRLNVRLGTGLCKTSSSPGFIYPADYCTDPSHVWPAWQEDTCDATHCSRARARTLIITLFSLWDMVMQVRWRSLVGPTQNGAGAPNVFCLLRLLMWHTGVFVGWALNWGQHLYRVN